MKKFFAALLALALLTGSCCALAEGMRQAADDAIDLYNILLPNLLETVYPERHDDFLPYFQLEYSAAVTEETGIPTYTGSQSLAGVGIYVSFVGEDSENPFSQLMLFCTTDDMELASGMLYPIVVYAGVLLEMDVDEINAIKAWIYASPDEGESIAGDRCVVTRMESESMLSFYLTTDGVSSAAETGKLPAKSSDGKPSGGRTPTTGFLHQHPQGHLGEKENIEKRHYRPGNGQIEPVLHARRGEIQGGKQYHAHMPPAIEGMQQAHGPGLFIPGQGFHDGADEHLRQAPADGAEHHGNQQRGVSISHDPGQNAQAQKPCHRENVRTHHAHPVADAVNELH